MPNSPTIVSAALSDKELQASINQMVANFDKGLQTMLEHSNEYVGKIQESLQKIGNTNFGAKGSNDGGVAKQTKAQKEATNETERRLKKEKEVNLTLDKQAEIMGRIPREMRMPDMAKSARESFQAFYKGFNEQARKLDSLIKAEDNRLASAGLGRFSAETQAQLAKVDASIDQTRWKMNFLYQEEKRLNQEALRQKVGSVGFEQAWLKKDETKSARVREGERLIELEKERQRIIASDPTVQQLDRNIEQTRAKIQQLLADEKRLQSESLKQTVGSSEFERLWNQKYQARDQRIAEQEKLIQLEKERQSLVAVDPIRTQLANVDELRAKHEKVLGVMRDETTTNNKVVESQQQVTSSTQQSTQAAQRYTEEIRKQAQAIRESKQWKETGTYSYQIGDATYYVSKKQGEIEAQLVRHKEQQVNYEKDYLTAGMAVEQSTKQQASTEEKLVQAEQQRLGIEQQITQEKEKQKKKYTSPTSNEWVYNQSLYNNFIKSRLGGKSPVSWKENTSDINTLNAALSQLRKVYSSLTSEERAHPYGQSTLDQIQRLERRLNVLRSEMSRPLSLNAAMGLSEKTLDDIAYKMRQLASYRSGLNVETQVKEIEQVNNKYAQLQKNMNDIMQKNTDMIASNTALGRSWNYMKNRLAFYFTVGAGTSFVKQLIDIRSQYELLERSIGILFDSMQTGSKIFSELNQMAIKSPFTTMELGSAAKQLSAYNIAAKDVVDTTRRLADMAAAVGIPIERLTYALGQIKSYGYLNSRDARMFANAGIPLIQNLADMYTKLEGRLVSIGDVYDRIKKKQVSFEDTLKVVHEMTDEGGRFFNFQEKAADTLKVRLANLTLAWNNMLNNMGKSNQGVLTSGLGVLKEMFENWRKIENIVLAIATNLGVVKAIQLLILLNAKGITKQMALQEVLGKRLGATIYGIARNLKMLAVNPMTWLTIAITAVTYLSWKFWDLTTANENFNKSIADGTKENIASIDKFFDKYRKDIESVGSMNTTDQEKMWERVREEIEKTTKNAQQYIDILEKIPELDKRVSRASGFLEQEKVIQEELNRLAQHGYFNIGGGFADDSYAETLTAIDKYTGEMIRKYGTYEDYIKAFKKEFQGFYDEFRDVKFSWNLNEEIGESVNHFKKLENLNWGRILSGGTDEEKLARIRDTFMSLRDNFFATEEMQNAGAEAQALYNRHMDYWITSIAKANGLIKELTANGKTYSAEDVAAVEERRTEWELFFSYLSDEERRTMDYLVKTNQTGGEEFKKIWDTMADSMKKSNATAYRDLQKKIAELRETPDIVINVVYREMRDKLDEQQQAFEDRWIRPENWTARNLSAEEYMEEETANRKKYGRLMRKTEEDNAEWEERLGKEYQENAKKIKSLNAQLQNKNKLSEADREQKEKDLNLYKDLNKAIDDIGKTENFNYDQFKKGGKGSKKDPLLDALKQEISLVEKLQNDYDKLSKSGASQSDALGTIRGAYGKTIRLLNAQLGGYGLPQIDISQLITGKDPNKALAHFKQTLNTLVSKGLLTLERSKELEAVVEKFTLSAKTYNLDMITKGLNNELGKLKDEYELAVELDADPELGNAFADMFGINTSTLPKTFGDALDRAQIIINRKLAEMNITTPFDLMEGNIDSFAKSTGLDKDGAVIKELVSAQNAYRDMFKKNITETEKMLDDYIKKYGDYSDKIAEIEAGRLEKLKKLNEAYYTEEMRKRPEYTAKLNAIEQGASKEKQQVDFDDFKNSRYYTMMFENLDYISTKTIRDMRDRVRGLIDTMNDLTPEQLKTLMSQYEKLEQKLVKRSPFKTLTKDLKEYFATSKERKAANQEFKNAQKEYDAQKKNVAALKEKYEQAKANSNTSKSYLDFLQIEINGENDILKILKEQLDAAEKKADKYNLTAKLAKSEALQVANVVGQNLQSLGELRDFLQQDLGVELSDELNGLVDGLSKVGQGINKITSSATSGDIVGVITGVGQTIYGLYDGIASIFGGGSTSDKKITKQIQDSERAVKRLELAYKNLEVAIENAYGANVIGAKQAAIANKELQLAELNRQLALEKSRDGKDRDEDKIVELQGQIIDLQNEIKKSSQEIINDLLGISSVADAAMQFADTYIEALRKGEDANKAFQGSFKEMIANMIKQIFVAEVIGPELEKLVKGMRERIANRSKKEADAYEKAKDKETRLSTMNGKEILSEMTGLPIRLITWDMVEQNKDLIEKYVSSVNAEVEKTKKELDKATIPTIEDMNYLAEGGKKLEGELGAWEDWYNGLLDMYGLKDTTKNLSALQQGIQGITEDTAGALEGITNGISQQSYLQSDLLTQIRDAVISMDMDVNLSVMSQILLQLQNSYQTQQAIQQILEGVLVPSGRAFSVELVS